MRGDETIFLQKEEVKKQGIKRNYYFRTKGANLEHKKKKKNIRSRSKELFNTHAGDVFYRKKARTCSGAPNRKKRGHGSIWGETQWAALMATVKKTVYYVVIV